MDDEQRSGRGEIYHIRIEGRLDEKWADWFEGFAMTSRGNGETLLTGPVEDQAALHGVLNKIGGLGLPLLLVAQTGCPCPKKNCPRRGQCQACAAYHEEKGRPSYCFRERTKWDRRCTALVDVK
jgi:hypothetical protein